MQRLNQKQEMERVFKRKIYQKLLDWKEQEAGKTALLIEGARRVGKSTIVEEFARNEYEAYLLIDFSIASKATKALFEDISNLDMLFTSLQLTYGVSLKPRKSLVIFDEIQKGATGTGSVDPIPPHNSPPSSPR